MATRLPSDLGTILLSIKQKLINDGVFAFNTCWISLQPQVQFAPPSDVYGVIQPLQQTIDQGVVMGAGNDGLYVNGECGITVWSRDDLDQFPHAESYLTDPGLGALGKLKCVINSLQLYDPVGTSANPILGEPMRLVAVERPEYISKPGWGSISSRWEIRYLHALTCP